MSDVIYRHPQKLLRRISHLTIELYFMHGLTYMNCASVSSGDVGDVADALQIKLDLQYVCNKFSMNPQRVSEIRLTKYFFHS